ncbi:MAG: hypothetical protein ACLGH8_11425 [Bacteroidia bacterium]
MKTIHIINSIATWATILLYITIYFGMLSQVVLGPLQLILATIISVRYYKELNLNHKNLVLYYWIAAVIALTMAGFAWSTDFYNTALTIVAIFVIPITVACYFLYVTNKLNKHLSHENPETPNPGI